MQIQVEKKHYDFSRYIDKRRWASLWHQVDEVVKFNPNKVLEIGPGAGYFKSIASTAGLGVETLDIDPNLKPDHIASVFDMPFSDGAYDVVCAFQMLEHLPFDKSLLAFKEMLRVSANAIIISLPDSRPRWPTVMRLPLLGNVSFALTLPRLKAPIHEFNGEHYWEISKRGYSLSQVIKNFSSPNIRLIKYYHPPENPSHIFFVFEKI